MKKVSVTFLILVFLSLSVAGSVPDCDVLSSLQWQAIDASWNTSSSSSDCCLWTGVTCDPTHHVVLALTLANKMISATLPAALGKLSNLRSLDLSFNSLSGTLPASWNNSLILSLKLAHNRLSGILPPSWGASLPALQYIDLSYNYLSGGPPMEWRNLSSLGYLTLSNNKLDGTLPPEYSILSSLRYLDFTYNQLTGTLPASWSAWIFMGYMSLSNNKLHGTLPPEWGSMTYIQFLGVESNQMVGSVPRDWCNFSSAFVAVNLGSNLFDELPLAIFNDRTCKLGLMLAENRFSGSLPSTIVAPLVGLVMNHNNLSGAVPSHIDIAIFDLAYNAFTEMPCISGALTTIYLVGNPITRLPDPAGCQMPNLTSLVVSDCPLVNIPLRLDLLLPNLTTFVARNTTQQTLSQALPQFAPDKLTVLDLSLNNVYACPQLVKLAADVVFVDTTEMTTAATCNSIQRLSCESSLCLSVTGGMNTTCPTSNCLMRLNDRTAVNTTRYLFGSSPAGVIKLYFHSNPTLTSLDDVASFMFLLKYISPKLNNVIVVDFYKFLTTEISVSYQPTLLLRSSPPSWSSQKVPLWNNSVVQMPPIPSAWLKFTSLDATMLLHNVTYALQFLFISENPLVKFVDKNFVLVTSAEFTALPCSAGLVGVPYTTLCGGCPAMATCNGTAQWSTSVAWRPANDVLPLYQCRPTSQGCTLGDGTQCDTGYTGPLCSVCDDGYGGGYGQCTKCASTGGNTVSTVVVVIFALLLVSFATYKSTVFDQDAVPLELTISNPFTSGWKIVSGKAWLLIKLLSNHFSLASPLVATTTAQTLSQGAFMVLKVQSAAAGPSVTEYNFVACLFPNFTANGQLVLAIVVVIPLIFFELGVVKFLSRGKVAVVTVISVSACVLQLLYMSLVTNAATVLQYDNFVFYNQTAYLIDSGRLPAPFVIMRPMTGDRRLDFTSNGLYYALGWCTLLVFGLGIPAKFVFSYWSLRDEDPTLHMAQEQLSFLVKNFRPSRWYWEAVIMLRKMGSLAAVSALRSYPVAQIQCYIIVIALYVGWHSHASPNLSRNSALVESISCFSAIATANVLLFSYANPEWIQSSGPSVVIMLIQISSFVAIVYGVLKESERNDFDAHDVSMMLTPPDQSLNPLGGHHRTPAAAPTTDNHGILDVNTESDDDGVVPPPKAAERKKSVLDFFLGSEQTAEYRPEKKKSSKMHFKRTTSGIDDKRQSEAANSGENTHPTDEDIMVQSVHGNSEGRDNDGTATPTTFAVGEHQHRQKLEVRVQELTQECDERAAMLVTLQRQAEERLANVLELRRDRDRWVGQIDELRAKVAALEEGSRESSEQLSEIKQREDALMQQNAALLQENGILQASVKQLSRGKMTTPVRGRRVADESQQ